MTCVAPFKDALQAEVKALARLCCWTLSLTCEWLKPERRKWPSTLELYTKLLRLQPEASAGEAPGEAGAPAGGVSPGEASLASHHFFRRA